jgi:replicative DNA helicase
MSKEEIRKQIVQIESEINLTIAKAVMLSKDQVTKLDNLYSEMERLQFKLSEEEDGVQ